MPSTPLIPRAETPTISLIVPVYNEEGAIDLFLEEVVEILAATECPYELLFVNDGSGDGTLEALRRAKRRHPEIVILSLARNFGKEAALTAGLDRARGDVVIPLDADLQDPPELIHKFLGHWRQGYDVVYGVRTDRRKDSLFKRTTARWFYKLFNNVSRLQIPENAGDYRLLDRRVVEEIRNLRERTRFMKVLMAWPGFHAIGVPFERPERSAGRSSLSVWKLWNLALDGITSSSTAPLRLWMYLGASISALSFLFAMIIVVSVVVRGSDIPGYPSLMVAVTFFGGLQLLSVGLIGEYLGRVFEESKQRPIYVVDFVEE